MSFKDPEQEQWRLREGKRGELRTHAQRLDPNLTAFCRECGERFTGSHEELTSKMTTHNETAHG